MTKYFFNFKSVWGANQRKYGIRINMFCSKKISCFTLPNVKNLQIKSLPIFTKQLIHTPAYISLYTSFQDIVQKVRCSGRFDSTTIDKSQIFLIVSSSRSSVLCSRPVTRLVRSVTARENFFCRLVHALRWYKIIHFISPFRWQHATNIKPQ